MIAFCDRPPRQLARELPRNLKNLPIGPPNAAIFAPVDVGALGAVPLKIVEIFS
jgi:hypothetical protein